MTVKLVATGSNFTKGDDIRLLCKVHGVDETLVHSITWFLDGNRIENHSRRKQIEGTGELLLENVTSEDSGKYSCQSTRGSETVSSDEAVINVLGNQSYRHNIIHQKHQKLHATGLRAFLPDFSNKTYYHPFQNFFAITFPPADIVANSREG